VVTEIDKAYNALVDAGIPAEDARGLLPHATTTRIIYTTNLRSLFEHAGNRLCTQAQFEWRAVFLGIMQALREFRGPITGLDTFDAPKVLYEYGDAWQWRLIAEPRPMSFAPVCYKIGKCAFMSELDRGCSIRSRVQAFAERGIPPAEWSKDHLSSYSGPDGVEGGELIFKIHPSEWMANPWAGITTKHNERPS
jgi:hypothetical protein